MREDFVQAIWRHLLFKKDELFTSAGAKVEIIHPGIWQHDAGPDFHAARIKINGILWVGNVEIHVDNQQWYQHKHHLDPAYDNVVLHVVLHDDDAAILSSSGQEIPRLELKKHISDSTFANYETLMHDLRELPCKSCWIVMESIELDLWLERMCLERMENKLQQWTQRPAWESKDWPQLFYEQLMKHFGFYVNAEPMLQLAQILPYKLIQKNVDQPIRVQALLFGQAGLLERNFIEIYPVTLQKEYRFLARKYDLRAMDSAAWKYSKMRPANFPDIRLAQVAALFQHQPDLFNFCRKPSNIKDLRLAFQIPLPKFWDSHYHLDQQSIAKKKTIGRGSAEAILMNTLVLLWLLMAKSNNDFDLQEQALNLLSEMRFEKNRYSDKFVATQFKFSNALQSQGLRHLWENYCEPKKCVSCSIGIKYLNQKINDTTNTIVF
jgi:hypothetical protein